MEMLLLLMTMPNSKHQKDDNNHKISHSTLIDHYNTSSQQLSEDITLGKHQWLQQLVWQFCTMWADDQPTDWKKTISTGAGLAGTARILSNKYPRGTTSIRECLQALCHCRMIQN